MRCQIFLEYIQITMQEHFTCPHNQAVTFICRNQKCLTHNAYLVCRQECLVDHFDHPKDLISFDVFYQSVLSLHQNYKKDELELAAKIRQTLNKLLHMRRSILQYIDTEIQVVKKMLAARPLPTLLECIYLIKSVDTQIPSQESSSEHPINFQTDDSQKQIIVNLNKTLVRISRNINSVLNKNIQIIEYDDEADKKKSYEIKIEGGADKIIKLLKTVPEHIDRLKIYLNEEYIFDLLSTYGEQRIGLCLVCNILVILRRVYKRSYEILLEALCTVDWIKKIHLVVWDHYLSREGKIALVRDYRGRMENITSFTLEDKLNESTCQI